MTPDPSTSTTLPAVPQNLHHVWNQRIQKYDVIDLATGKMYDPVNFDPSPINYSILMADHICALVREGKTLTSICQMPDMPSIHRLYTWVHNNPELKEKLKEAKKDRADAYADLALEIALRTEDKNDVPAAKLKIETLKWAAEKANPETYGKKEESGVKGGPSINITLHTGVLDSVSPKDIIVDEFGNFRGFENENSRSSREWSDEPCISSVELSRDRWQTASSGSEDRDETKETEEG